MGILYMEVPRMTSLCNFQENLQMVQTGIQLIEVTSTPQTDGIFEERTHGCLLSMDFLIQPGIFRNANHCCITERCFLRRLGYDPTAIVMVRGKARQSQGWRRPSHGRFDK